MHKMVKSSSKSRYRAKLDETNVLSMDAQSNIQEPHLLIKLSKVPHLTHAFASWKVLKELRSICSETQRYSRELITGQ